MVSMNEKVAPSYKALSDVTIPYNLIQAGDGKDLKIQASHPAICKLPAAGRGKLDMWKAAFLLLPTMLS